MDWETFLGLTGLYVLTVASLYHQFIMTRRIANITSTIKEILTERRNLIMKKSQERVEAETEKREGK